MTPFVDENDSIWVRWRTQNSMALCPSKVLHVGTDAAGDANVKLRVYNDSGLSDEIPGLALCRQALTSEGKIRSSARHHMDWAYRTRPVVCEADFKQSAYLGSGSGTQPQEQGGSGAPIDLLPPSSKRRSR